MGGDYTMNKRNGISVEHSLSSTVWRAAVGNVATHTLLALMQLGRFSTDALGCAAHEKQTVVEPKLICTYEIRD